MDCILAARGVNMSATSINLFNKPWLYFLNVPLITPNYEFVVSLKNVNVILSIIFKWRFISTICDFD